MAESLFKEFSQKESCFKPGSTLCRGCMESIAFNNVGKATDNGRKTVFTMGTFCGEVSTLAWPNVVAWGRGEVAPTEFTKSFSIIHNVFESAPTVAEAVRDVSDILNEQGACTTPVNIVSNSGDGGALSIGLRSLLHTINRQARITIVVLINEFYANTGFQYGPTATLFSDTSTTPATKESHGNAQMPLNHVGLCVMAGAGFVAQISPAFPNEFAAAVKKALDCPTTAIIFVPAPCITGWKFEEGQTVELARYAAKSGLFPVFTKERGQQGKVSHVDTGPKRKESLLHFLALQRRFQHLVTLDSKTNLPVIRPGADVDLAKLEEWIDAHVSDLEKLTQIH